MRPWLLPGDFGRGATGARDTVEVRMVAAYHFMHDVYGPFNAPIRITPPR